MCVCVCVHELVYPCVHVSVHACMFMCTRLRAYMRACAHINIFTLIKPADCGILGGNVSSGRGSFLYKVGYNHLVRGVYLRVPVGYNAHPWLTVAKLLTEVSILGVRVSTSVRVVETNVEEERSETKYRVYDVTINTELHIKCVILRKSFEWCKWPVAKVKRLILNC